MEFTSCLSNDDFVKFIEIHRENQNTEVLNLDFLNGVSEDTLIESFSKINTIFKSKHNKKHFNNALEIQTQIIKILNPWIMNDICLILSESLNSN